MKRYLNVLFAALAVFALGGCDKEENQVIYEGGTPPALTASRTTIPLSFANQDMEAISLNWTNPNYKFNTGVSSQNVTYTLEIDTTGANFTNPARKTIVYSNGLNASFKQSEINDFLLNSMNLRVSTPHNIEMRIVATIGNGSAAKITSNVLKFTGVTPYVIPPKVTPPASGKLYITGDATPASWMAGGDPENVSQRFTQISPLVYELPSVNLVGGKSYLFVPVYGNWNDKFGFIGANNQNNVNGDDFKYNGGDMLSPAASGAYKIQVDFQRGKFTVTKL